MYLYCALADLAQLRDDASLLHACERFWLHLCSTRMYITGGVGSSERNEGLTEDYDLPNRSAYAETCAAIGLVIWGHRMLQHDADRRYADVVERALYNGVLSGLSLDGTSFFYVNPLESHGQHHRQPWFYCACCPPNIARLLADLGEYVYGLNENELIVHLYLQNTVTFALSGQQITLHQQTRYPWEGNIQLSLDMEQPTEFAINLRIPGWCPQASLLVNGEPIPLEPITRKGYARVVRLWRPGDSLHLDLSMPIQLIHAHPDICDNNGCVALQRGPLIYCLESADNHVSLHRVRLSEHANLESHFTPDLLEGVTVLRGSASVLYTDDWNGELYRPTSATYSEHPLVAIPYYAWDNRESGEMRVWIRTR
jgi:DUF1680 family protein